MEAFVEAPVEVTSVKAFISSISSMEAFMEASTASVAFMDASMEASIASLPWKLL